jgi:hypothetical protein
LRGFFAAPPLKEVAGTVHSQTKPEVMFWRCVDILVRERIEVPSYARLTKLILNAISRRSQELAAIIERTLTQNVQALVDSVRCETAQRGLAASKTTTSETSKHLIIERPVALDLAGLQHLRAAVDANGVKTDRQFRAEMESVLSG